jgi:hypothetical protein
MPKGVGERPEASPVRSDAQNVTIGAGSVFRRLADSSPATD